MAGVIELNGRRYRSRSGRPSVICVDGFDPAYVERGIGDGILPTIAGFAREGWLGTADAVMPTFTNPNNVSIVTGAPPAVHGIAGNYYLDRETGRRGDDHRRPADAQRDDPRADVASGRCHRCGHRQGQVAADARAWPRRRVFFVGMRRCRGRGDGRARPARHVLGRSVAVRARRRVEAARTRRCAAALSCRCPTMCSTAMRRAIPRPTRFITRSTERVARFVELGAVVGLVADHGMNDKPHVIFLEDELTRPLRPGSGAGDLSDHRPVRAPSRGARLVRARLRPRPTAISRR